MDPVVGDDITYNLKGSSLTAKLVKRNGIRLRVENSAGVGSWVEMKDVTAVSKGVSTWVRCPRVGNTGFHYICDQGL